MISMIKVIVKVFHRHTSIILSVVMSLVLVISLCGCGNQSADEYNEQSSDNENTVVNGETYILYTSDVHCGIDKGFGYAGLAGVRKSLEDKGYTTILVDNGDSIQGESVGTVSRGETIIKLMNDMKYDVAIPGNHEFDYGMERFLELAEKADFPYISCNFNLEGKLIFEPYIIKEVSGTKIAFVGVTTPQTLSSLNPKYFRNKEGEFVYGFMQDEDGSALYEAVQNAVDAARADGASLVYVMGHAGNDAVSEPWTCVDIISHTNGIDVFLDGHSHDTEQIVTKNKDGEDVIRSAVGTKLNAIGYSHVSAEGEIIETGIWSWPNEISLQELIEVDNEMARSVEEVQEEVKQTMEEVVATSEVELTIVDPQKKDLSGNPIRIVHCSETNLGDLCADAYRVQSGADIAIVNGGGIRNSIAAGEVTYEDIINVFPYSNYLSVIEVTGQQILDALEWGSRFVPEESGTFLHVSGLTYEINSSIDSSCIEGKDIMFAGVSGDRRISNVMIGDEPLDASENYTLVSDDYTLFYHGDGFTMFDGAKVIQDKWNLDNQVLIDYISKTLGGVIGDEYENPYGQGRIVIR